MRKFELAALGLVFLSFVIAFYFYPQMPEKMASHWNARGEVDGYMPKFWGLLFMPLLSFILLVFFLIIPRIDPLKDNIQKFRGHFDMFILLFVLFLLYLYVLTILWSLGFRYNMLQFLAPAFGILFYYVGVLTEHAKRNWFVGIRTPWTMSSDLVWEKTNRLGGKMFKFSGAISVLGAFAGDYAILFVIIPALLTAAYAFIYSYLEYQKETRGRAEKTGAKKKKK